MFVHKLLSGKHHIVSRHAGLIYVHKSLKWPQICEYDQYLYFCACSPGFLYVKDTKPLNSRHNYHDTDFTHSEAQGDFAILPFSA
jgi:hypothetical protein